MRIRKKKNEETAVPTHIETITVSATPWMQNSSAGSNIASNMDMYQSEMYVSLVCR